MKCTFGKHHECKASGFFPLSKKNNKKKQNDLHAVSDFFVIRLQKHCVIWMHLCISFSCASGWMHSCFLYWEPVITNHLYREIFRGRGTLLYNMSTVLHNQPTVSKQCQYNDVWHRFELCTMICTIKKNVTTAWLGLGLNWDRLFSPVRAARSDPDPPQLRNKFSNKTKKGNFVFVTL